MHGTMSVVLLSHKKLANIFRGWDLVTSLCDPCVWSKDVESKQITITFHADDFMTVTKFIKLSNQNCGTKDLFTVTRGKRRGFLGMTLNFDAAKNAFVMSRCDFVKKLHVSLSNYLRGPPRTTAAPDFLLKVDPTAELVEQKKQDQHD